MNYQVMPELSPEEYAELKADIAARGVMVPIEYDELGDVLDGHHRLKVCRELGIDNFPKVIRAGMTEAEKRTHARKLNMARRQLNQDQRKRLIEEEKTQNPKKSNRQIAKDLGVSPDTVNRVTKEMEATERFVQSETIIGADGREYRRDAVSRPAEKKKPVSVFMPTRREERALKRPEVVERISETGESALTAEKQINREAKAERKKYELQDEIPADACKLFHADIRGGLPEIADNSVDFIITDPPYPREYIPLYANLSALAARALKPGGSLLVMCGQSYLPEIMQMLSSGGMSYHWTLAYMTPGGQSPKLWNKRTNTFWKPILWYVKGEYSGDYVGDVIKSPSNDNDKHFHEWGQSLGGMRDIVERFTNPGQTIFDPFLGGGTTGVAAIMMGRKFIGTDIEQKNIDISMNRIMEAYNARGKT